MSETRGKQFSEWPLQTKIEFARRDDCLDRLVPSDLRLLLAENAAKDKALRSALSRMEEIRPWVEAVPSILGRQATLDLLDNEIKSLETLLGEVEDA